MICYWGPNKTTITTSITINFTNLHTTKSATVGDEKNESLDIILRAQKVCSSIKESPIGLKFGKYRGIGKAY